MNIKILMGMSSYFLSTLPHIQLLYCLKNSITASCCCCCCTIHSLYSFNNRMKCSVFSCLSIAEHILSAICEGKLFLIIVFCVSLETFFTTILYKSCIVIISLIMSHNCLRMFCWQISAIFCLPNIDSNFTLQRYSFLSKVRHSFIVS